MPRTLIETTNEWRGQGYAVHLHADLSGIVHSDATVPPALTLEVCERALVTQKMEDVRAASVALHFGAEGFLRNFMRGMDSGIRWFIYAEGAASESPIKAGARADREADLRPQIARLDRERQLYATSQTVPPKGCLGTAEDVFKLVYVRSF